jgi:putative metallohydrolase (TIGR04338 family)
VPTVDARRSRVYAAEQQVARLLDRASRGAATVDFFGSTLTIPAERRFGDVPAMQRWVDAVLALGPVQHRWPGTPPCLVRRRRGAARAHYQPPGEMAVPDSAWAARELVLCHELAHHLAHHDPAVPPGVPAHGEQFVQAYLDLVDVVIGPEVALLLRTGLAEAGASR